MINATPVILCGGSGTRLWPLSRAGFPKQFLSLTGHDSLFQQAVKRVMHLDEVVIKTGSPIILTGEEHRFLAAEQLREMDMKTARVLLEPVGRNTAPALTFAALVASEEGQDPVLLVTPADQTIADQMEFQAAMNAAIMEAANGSIVILGITPSKPHTGYGYIEVTNLEKYTCNRSPLRVKNFIEKPDEKSATSYIKTGRHFWNAGIFVLRASTWIKAIKKFRSDVYEQTNKAWEQRALDGRFMRAGPEDFKLIPEISVDYAVLEHCPGTEIDIKMIPLTAGWSDLGAWDTVWEALPKDSHGNTHSGDVISINSKNTLVQSNNRLVSVVGVSDLIVVETPDAVLVASKSQSQDVKHIVSQLASKERVEKNLHRKVHRPWGWYDSVDEGDRFKVKRIHVKPKASLSLQKHHHRAEHWVVVKGTAEITNADKSILLSENQSTFIPLGVTHRLSNPGSIPLEIIEIQSGSYLGEDDIVRLEDNYGRHFQPKGD